MTRAHRRCPPRQTKFAACASFWARCVSNLYVIHGRREEILLLALEGWCRATFAGRRHRTGSQSNSPTRRESCLATGLVALLTLETFRAPLASPLASMTRFLLRSHGLLVVSVVLLLGVVVSLSTATRRPCLHVCSGAWRLWKAGRMTKPESLETSNQRVKVEPATPPVVAAEARPLFPWLCLRLGDTVPPANSVLAQIRHFRSPPRLT